MSSELNRRSFFKVAGVGTAAGIVACTPRVEEKIIPHVIPPDDQIPGEALWFASTCNECSAGCGTLVRNREGRALKVEGNPQHPLSRGGLCAIGHSALQANYHPDRYRHPLVAGSRAEWDAALAAATTALQAGGVAVLTGALPAGTLDTLFDTFAQAVKGARVVYEPLGDEPLAAAAEIVFGKRVLPAFRLERAGYVLSIGADFLETWQQPVAQQKGFAQAHGYGADKPMAKLTQIEPRLSVTAAKADEWLANQPGSELKLALALLRAILDAGAAKGLTADEQARVRAWIGDVDVAAAAAASGIAAETVDRLARELTQYGPALVLAGGAANQGADATALHVAVLLLNKALGGVGTTIGLGHGARPQTRTGQTAGFAKLLADIAAGTVTTLVVYGTNPVFAAPAAWNVGETFKKLKHLIALDALPNETTALATVLLPDHGALEGWGDHRSGQGVYALRQPGMKPLWDTRDAGDTLLQLLGAAAPAPTFHELLRNEWRAVQAANGGGDFEVFWEEALKRGGVFFDVAEPALAAAGDLSKAPATSAVAVGAGEFALVAYPQIFRRDGRFANRPWLQEIPDPLTQTVWSGLVEIHPNTAKRLGIKQGDLVEIATSGGTTATYAYLTSGVQPDVIGLAMGQGHDARIGRYGAGIEGNAYAAIPATTDAVTGALVLGGARANLKKLADASKIIVSGNDENLVNTDGARSDLGRGIAQVVALKDIRAYDRGEAEVPHVEHHGTRVLDENGFYPPHEHPAQRWGMVVDTHACTGCGGCVAACYSENNIPVIGKELVARGREMAWIRIERYFESEAAVSDTRFVPMMCQHCNNAPCEPVCPALATYHTQDGLNGMVYNRCIGTRYCGNNCSYKVRRFNYFGYDDPKQEQHAWPEPLNLMLNPDVSVRSKGVMEKCTFCVQRIRGAQEMARLDGRPLADGDVTPACAQACPADAIVFGDLNDANSRVSKKQHETHRGYKVLDVLNTQPSVTYLKKVHWTGV